MRIAFIVPSLANKGPIIVAHTIITHLIQNNIDVDVYYFDESGNIDFPCATTRISMNTPFDFGHYDLIHSHMYRPDKYVNHWIKHISRAGVKTVTTIHQNIYDNIKYSHNRFVAIGLQLLWLPYIRRFNAAVPISQELFSTYRRYLPNIIAPIHNGVDIIYDHTDIDPHISREMEVLRNTNLNIIGTYAAITRRKGIDQLIILLNKRKDLALIIIGEGTEILNLKKLTERLGLTHRVRFFPYLKKPYNYLKYIDIYAMPSRAEGFGLAHVEAAFTHTPIVCSDIPVFHEIFRTEDAAFFELENIDSLSDAVDRCLRQKITYAKNAYETVSSRFSGSAMTYKYISLYKKLCNIK